jgi:hypothetical protein
MAARVHTRPDIREACSAGRIQRSEPLPTAIRGEGTGDRATAGGPVGPCRPTV